MKYKAIIFDMDGTIISSEDLWKESTKNMLKEKGNLSDQDCLKVLPELKGASLYTTCAYIRMNFNTTESVEELMRQKEAFVFKQFKTYTKFIDGFESFHNKLATFELKSAIATNATLSTLEQTRSHFPLDTFFKEHIYCIDHVGKKPKPQPDVFLHAADKLNTPAQQCIVIEDSTHGIAAAKAAGMFCIGINTGNDHHALSQADMIIEHYDDIDLEKIL